MYQDVTSTFESFYTGTSPRLLRYAYGLTGDMAEAQDFTQEAYTRAWLRWKRLQRYENPESWLRLVVSRLAVDRLRWLGVRRAKAPREAAVVLPPNEDMLTLVAALKRLPMPQRKALVLHYFLDMPVAEIAAETGTNVNTVKTWLARGRVNVAAELTEVPPAKQDLQEIRNKARRRRHRTVASSVAAFLATATAAAAAFFAFPGATPSTLRPDLILPYPDQPRRAATIVIDQRAFAVWHGVDGKAQLGAIDLSTDTQPWPPIELGTFDDSLFTLGSHDGVMLVIGTNDSAQANDITVLGVDVASGKVRWRRSPQLDGGPLFDVQTLAANGNAAQAGIVVFTDQNAANGIDWATGRPVWTVASTADTRYAAPNQNRVAQIQPGGVLRILDVTTGRVMSERSGLPEVVSRGAMLLDDWLYLPVDDGVRRIRLTGTEPASRLTEGSDVRVLRCGKHICVNGRDFVAAFDRGTGKQLWRREVKPFDFVQATEAGVIMTIAGTGPKGSWERAPDDRQVILDPDGADITPNGLGTRTASWIDNETLMFEREIERAIATGSEIPPRNVELSVYSLATHEERSLGSHLLYGNCTGIDGKYVCAGKDGFILFH